MRKTYPSTSDHIPLPGRPAVLSPQMGQRMSLLALQEELQLQTRQGLVDTHRLRIIRIEQSAMLSDPLTLPHSPFQEPVPVSAQLAAAPRRTASLTIPLYDIGPRRCTFRRDTIPSACSSNGKSSGDAEDGIEGCSTA